MRSSLSSDRRVGFPGQKATNEHMKWKVCKTTDLCGTVALAMLRSSSTVSSQTADVNFAPLLTMKFSMQLMTERANCSFSCTNRAMNNKVKVYSLVDNTNTIARRVFVVDCAHVAYYSLQRSS